MSVLNKKISLTQANKLIPVWNRCLDRLLQIHIIIQDLLPEGEQLIGSLSDPNTSKLLVANIIDLESKHPKLYESFVALKVLLMAAEDSLNELSKHGCTPSLTNATVSCRSSCGEDHDVVLCWKLGDSQIKFWHGVEDSYEKRKPIETLVVD